MKNKQITNEELQHLIVRLNFGSNEIFDSMNVIESKNLILWNEMNKIIEDIENVVNKLREIKNK